jgi:hypothetical protein
MIILTSDKCDAMYVVVVVSTSSTSTFVGDGDLTYGKVRALSKASIIDLVVQRIRQERWNCSYHIWPINEGQNSR